MPCDHELTGSSTGMSPGHIMYVVMGQALALWPADLGIWLGLQPALGLIEI
jgi:hypothetical protein